MLGTFNVLDLRPAEGGLEIDLEVFGTHDVPIAAGFAPMAVESVDHTLTVEGYAHGARRGVTTVTVSGRDIQGDTGTIHLAR